MKLFSNNFRFAIVLVCVFCCGCATLSEKYQRINSADGIDAREAKIIAQYQISEHPLKDKFNLNHPNIKKINTHIWQVEFSPKEFFNYNFRLHIDALDGVVKRMGIVAIPLNSTTLEGLLSGLFTLFSSQEMNTEDFRYFYILAQFIHDKNRWPLDQNEIVDFIVSLADQNGVHLNKIDIEKQFDGVSFSSDASNALILHLPQPARYSNDQFLFDPNDKEIRSIVIKPLEGVSDQFEIQYPSSWAMLLQLKGNSITLRLKEVQNKAAQKRINETRIVQTEDVLGQFINH